MLYKITSIAFVFERNCRPPPAFARAHDAPSIIVTAPSILEREQWDIDPKILFADVRWPFVAWRAFRLAWLATPLLLLYPFAGGSQWWRQRAKATLEASGVCAIKFGQWAAARPDLFSNELTDIFGDLTHQCSPHAWHHSKEAICAALSASSPTSSLSDLFSSIETTALASGACAQIHVARRRDDNTLVALKVLHPAIEQTLLTDLYIIYCFARIFERFDSRGRWLAPTLAVTQFGASMLKQLDLRIEAENLKRLGENFAGDDSIVVPRVHTEFLSPTKDVLVESFEHGELLTSYLHRYHQSSNGIDSTSMNLNQSSIYDNVDDMIDIDRQHRVRIALTGFRCYLKMMLSHNFVHADLHAGNLLVRRKANSASVTSNVDVDNVGVEAADSGDVQLVLLDAGLCVHLTPFDFDNFVSLFGAVIRGEGRRGAEMMMKHAREIERMTPSRREQFVVAMDEIFSVVRSQPIRDVKVAGVLRSIMQLTREYGVMIEPNYVNLCLGTAVIEGLGRRLAPTLSISDVALPILMKQKKRIVKTWFGFTKIKNK